MKNPHATLMRTSSLITCTIVVAMQVADATDRLAVAFGTEITKLVPGYVSTEVDARLSYDVEGTIAKAKKIIELYKEKGIDK